jgi:hypothetical protein
MDMHTLTLTMPDNLYTQLSAQAKMVARSVDEIILQTLTRHLAPAVEEDLPAPLQAELKAMEQLSDDALWSMAKSTLNPDKIALYDTLLERLHEQTLTPEGREWLTRLREEADALMLRKAHAYALLKSRGHQLPSLDELRAEAA